MLVFDDFQGEIKQLPCKLICHAHRDAEAIYTAKLVGVTYRDSIITFGSNKRKKYDNIGYDSALKGGTQIGFDTGSDLTYLGPKLFKLIEKIVSSIHTLHTLVIWGCRLTLLLVVYQRHRCIYCRCRAVVICGHRKRGVLMKHRTAICSSG
jgi:hypothetical protein